MAKLKQAIKVYLDNFVQKFIGRKRLRRWMVRLVPIDRLYKINKNYLSVEPQAISTPESLEIPYYYRAQHLQKNSYPLPPIYTATIKNSIYCPKYEILLSNSRRVIADSINTGRDPTLFSIYHLYFNQLERIAGFCSVFRSTGGSMYYHTLLDNLPRLYLLAQPQYQDLPEIKLLISSQPTKLEQFFFAKLLPENVSPKPVDPNKLYQVDQLIFPSFMTRQFAGFLPTVYLDYLTEKVAPKRQRNPKNRIFISRVKTQRGRLRCLLNEEELFAELKEYGFKRYILEQLSIEEQIELFYDAEYVIGSHGAGLSNLIYSANAKVVELFPTHYVIPHYYYLSKSLNHTYRYWCGKAKEREANFTVDVKKIIEHVVEL